MIGILALQGAYQLHKNILDKLKEPSILVRDKEELKICRALIIPGGESTVILKLLHRWRLWQEIIDFAYQNKAIWGVCAGAILLSKSIINYPDQQTLNLIDITIIRNYYGSQIFTFTDNIDLINDEKKFLARFIRAPYIESFNSEIETLGYYKNNPVFIKKDKIMVTTFHPELDNDLRIHKYFVNLSS